MHDNLVHLQDITRLKKTVVLQSEKKLRQNKNNNNTLQMRKKTTGACFVEHLCDGINRCLQFSFEKTKACLLIITFGEKKVQTLIFKNSICKTSVHCKKKICHNFIIIFFYELHFGTLVSPLTTFWCWTFFTDFFSSLNQYIVSET